MKPRIAALVPTLLLLGGLVAWSATGATQSYTLTDLGPGTGSAVNDSGAVAGSIYTEEYDPDYGTYWVPRATVWSPATEQPTDLGIPNSVATGINGEGVVVGNSGSGAFRWEDGVATYLGTLPDFWYSVATGVNSSGRIVGYCYRYDDYGYYVSRAFLWENGVMTDLGTLGGSSSSAAAINDAGTVVGWSDLSDGWTRRAFAWDAAGGMRDLGAAEGNDSSTASAIDASGHAVGWSYPMLWWYDEYGGGVYPGPGTATLFDGGAAIALGGPDSYAYAVCDATADHGVRVVGNFADYACYTVVAALWEVDAAGQVTAYDMNDILDAPFTSELSGANAVNAAGGIVASGWSGSVFVLTPSTLPPVQQALHAPSYVAAVGSAGGVALSWSSVCGADGYVVQRGVAPGGPYQTIATGLTQTMFSDTSAPLGSTYYYIVAGVEGNMAGSPSAEVAAAPLPYAPANLTAKAGKGRFKSQVDLAWTASASSNIAHYKIYRYDPYAGSTLVATIGPATNYAVTGLARRATYYFWVTAVHAGGQESTASNVVSVVTSR